MLIQAFLYASMIFSVLVIQLIILHFFSGNKYKFNFKENILSFIIASLFIGTMFSLTSKFFNTINYRIISFILTASIISSYWFIVNPFKYLFYTKKIIRDKKLENEIKIEGHNYKIFLNKKTTSNAFATGILPFYKIVIVGEKLKEQLTKEQLKAIIYHEIGHHEKKHILKLFLINIILQTFFFVIFSQIYGINTNNSFIEPLLVGLLGGIAGFTFWFIPNRISYYFEYQADEYSATHYDKRAIADALKKLDEISEGKLTKGNYNHPTLTKRLNNLLKH